MPKKDLFNGDGDSSGEECTKISINKTYAAKYQKFKECQELDKLKQQYGDDGIEDSSSTSESEDDDAEALTPQIEKDFLKTLSMIKEKDPKIYEKDSVFFCNNNAIPAKRKEGVEKKQPLLLKDYERQRLLEKGEKAYLSDSDEDLDIKIKLEQSNEDLTYVEEQKRLKESLKAAAAADSASDDDDLLQFRQKKTPNEEEEVEGDKVEREFPKQNIQQALNRYWNNTQLDEGETFLRDYILKKQFIDHESSHLPSYNEVVGDAEDRESDRELDKEDEFERKFNFRYEEPDAEFIKQYPRTVNETVRKKDDRRKQQRLVREERKKKEQEKKKDELKRLKNLKRKEIMEKIEKLKEITGNEKVGFLEDDMENDFDISKYDQLMEQVFDDEYYNEDNSVDEEKPVFPDDGEEYFENYEIEEHLPHCEDPDFNMDADYNPDKQTSSKNKQKGKKRTGMNAVFAEVIEKEKPLFDPQQRTFEDYFDEYYKLDYEDIIGDMPIRFKYREVPANDFGLTTGEILKAEDKELNEWCSLRKTMQYIGGDEEKKERQKYKKKGRNKNKKIQIFSSFREELEEQVAADISSSNTEKISKPRNIKQLQKKKEKLNGVSSRSKHLTKKKTLIPSWNNQYRRNILSSVNKTKVKNIHRQFKGGNDKFIKKLSLQRLAAYGLDERKKKSK